jgi:glycosyltransferase involved in cell wall biosynthesis
MGRHYGLQPDVGRIEFIPECCPDSFFAKPLTSRGPRANRPIRLIGVGNWVRWKKWDLLLRAMASLPTGIRSHFRFTLWGPTPNEPDARSYAEELRTLHQQLNLGELAVLNGPSQSVPTLLSESDWFVLPSTNEPCSVALIEALAHGIPALVSNSGGNVDIVKPGHNGLHFNADSVESLAQQLTGIASDSIQPSSAEEIRTSVRGYAASSVAATYHRLYKSLC